MEQCDIIISYPDQIVSGHNSWNIEYGISDNAYV